MNHIEIPELILDSNHKHELLSHFREMEGDVLPNGVDGLHFLDLVDIPDCLQRIINKINPDYFRMIYYCTSNSDIEKHTDHSRSSAIFLEVVNKDRVPTSYHDGDTHCDIPTLMYTWKEHWVNNPNNTFRLFVHIDLNRDLRFDDYVREYNNGNLIVGGMK
jgi:LmbE family N-acetylglucosaminyl deacetylase